MIINGNNINTIITGKNSIIIVNNSNKEKILSLPILKNSVDTTNYFNSLNRDNKNDATVNFTNKTFLPIDIDIVNYDYISNITRDETKSVKLPKGTFTIYAVYTNFANTLTNNTSYFQFVGSNNIPELRIFNNITTIENGKIIPKTIASYTFTYLQKYNITVNVFPLLIFNNKTSNTLNVILNVKNNMFYFDNSYNSITISIDPNGTYSNYFQPGQYNLYSYENKNNNIAIKFTNFTANNIQYSFVVAKDGNITFTKDVEFYFDSNNSYTIDLESYFASYVTFEKSSANNLIAYKENDTIAYKSNNSYLILFGKNLFFGIDESNHNSHCMEFYIKPYDGNINPQYSYISEYTNSVDISSKSLIDYVEFYFEKYALYTISLNLLKKDTAAIKFINKTGREILLFIYKSIDSNNDEFYKSGLIQTDSVYYTYVLSNTKLFFGTLYYGVTSYYSVLYYEDGKEIMKSERINDQFKFDKPIILESDLLYKITILAG